MHVFDSDRELAELGLWVGERSYNGFAKEWLAASGHYLEAPPPGCLICVVLSPLIDGLFGTAPGPELRGMCLIGRPVARNLPQNGQVGEVTRFVLAADLPRGVASLLLRSSAARYARRPFTNSLISYHDRSRHSGCIYRKAGFRKDGVTRAGTRRGTWKSRPGREQAASSEVPSKRRWRLDLDAVRSAA